MTFLLPVLALLVSATPAPVRIAYGHAHPYSHVLDGKPAGFVIDVFEEAARREGIRLQWVLGGSHQENNQALADGRIDVLPMGVAFPERRQLFFVSEPWWSEESILLVRADNPGADPKTVRRLAMPRVLELTASTAYSNARRLHTQSAPQALERLCLGEADGALLGSSYIRQLVNSRPKACESIGLRIYDSPVAANYSIIAANALHSTAARLRERITQMTADGTLAMIAGRHPPISTPYATRMTHDLKARHDRQKLTMALVFVSAFLAVFVLLLLRQIVLERRLRRTIDEQRRTEQELRESEAALKQRTLDLIRSNEDLQAFAYSASHDLQEPLRNQALYSELIERRFKHVLPPEAANFLRIIRNSSLRAQEMLKSLLGYSRMGHPDRTRTSVNCSAVLDRVLSDLQFLLAETGARVEAGPLPIVWGWEDRLQQVFQNLIENAAKYRKQGVPPQIGVSAQRTEQEWKFAVTDNGIGFNQQYADKVFGLFKRLHGNDRYGGTGIGLAVCKRVVERHGGRIWVESSEGVGSTFYFTIPIPHEEHATEGSRLGVVKG